MTRNKNYSASRVPERFGYDRGILPHDRVQSIIPVAAVVGYSAGPQWPENAPSSFFPLQGMIRPGEGMIKIHPLFRVFLYFSPVRPSYVVTPDLPDLEQIN